MNLSLTVFDFVAIDVVLSSARSRERCLAESSDMGSGDPMLHNKVRLAALAGCAMSVLVIAGCGAREPVEAPPATNSAGYGAARDARADGRAARRRGHAGRRPAGRTGVRRDARRRADAGLLLQPEPEDLAPGRRHPGHRHGADRQSQGAPAMRRAPSPRRPVGAHAAPRSGRQAGREARCRRPLRPR